MHSVLSHFTGPFSYTLSCTSECQWPAGRHQLSQASDAQAGDPSQLAGLPSNLPVTSANDKTRRNGYRNTAAYWQWQQQFTGKERLISSEQLPFPLRERKGDSPRLSWRQRVQTEVYILFSPTRSQPEYNTWRLWMSPLAARGKCCQSRQGLVMRGFFFFFKFTLSLFNILLTSGNKKIRRSKCTQVLTAKNNPTTLRQL